MRRTGAALAGLLGCGALAGCAGAAASSSGCDYYTAFSVSPGSATADHSATAPGNQQRFTATEAPAGTGTGCVLPAHILLVQPEWTSSDPLNVSISSAKDDTNGLATCTGLTASPVTLTAKDGSGASALTTTATLSCK